MALMGNMREGPLAAIHGCRYFNPENDPDLAAVDLTWGEIRGPDGFLDRLNGITAGARSAGQIFRLPTEEEWEYACRAGTASRWSFGDDLDGLDAHAWTKRNSGGVVHPVGRKAPNLWGLYDMHGNVGEQCFDAGDPFNLGIVGPQVVRGGSYQSGALQCRSTAKSLLFGVNGARDVGFRVVLSKPLLASREQGNGPGQ
jgi:formylglycine-generating enzyme required for sulfatase activity